MSNSNEYTFLFEGVEMTDHLAEYHAGLALAIEEVDYQWLDDIGNNNNTVANDQESSDIVNNGLTNVVSVTDQVNNAVETDVVDKAGETDEVAVETDEVDKAVETDEVDKAVETDEVDKAVETDKVDKVVSTDKVDKVAVLTEQAVNIVRSVQKKRRATAPLTAQVENQVEQLIESVALQQVSSEDREVTSEPAAKRRRVTVKWTDKEIAILMSFGQVFGDMEDRWNWLLRNHSQKFHADRNVISVFKDKFSTTRNRLTTKSLGNQKTAKNKESIESMLQDPDFQKHFKESKIEWETIKSEMIGNLTYVLTTKHMPAPFNLENYF
jgi:hypothetical protein